MTDIHTVFLLLIHEYVDSFPELYRWFNDRSIIAIKQLYLMSRHKSLLG